VNFVQFYYICPTNAQYILTMCFLKHSYLFRRLYFILWVSLIMYAKDTKLIKWRYLYRWYTATNHTTILYSRVRVSL